MSQVPLVDCIGPDGKHLQVTQSTCTTFNTAWHHPSSPTPINSWGTAVKVGNHTYTLQYIPDDAQANSQEILEALNTYRQKNGIGIVTWADNLSKYAQTRADLFVTNAKLDEHVGFIDYVNHQDGFSKLGFNKLGENAAYAGPLTGIHIIENVFGGDAEHNANQLNSAWTYVGIGLNGDYIDVIFGGEKR